MPPTDAPTLDVLRRHAHELTDRRDALDPLMERIGERSLVLLGEATHGTHEFYDVRVEITKRLVREKGFDAVAVEADWPAAQHATRVVRGDAGDVPAVESLAGFTRFPLWMWRNADVLDLMGWLEEWNRARPRDAHVGFYGLDMYSLHESVHAVISYLSEVDPRAAERARSRYSCFDMSADDPQSYGFAASVGTRPDCEDAAVEQLMDLQRRRSDILARDGRQRIEEQFYAEQNARVVQAAEHYYRSMFGGRVNTWNLRDRHMADTLDALQKHLRDHGGNGKVVVWAHNSHVGDARATEMGGRGELNIGQLTRERHGDDGVLVGFTTHSGTVSAASGWDLPVERKRVRPSLDGSFGALFHDVGVDRFLLPMEGEVADALREPRLERAIGVVYMPQTERWSHYFHAELPEQFDVVLHYDVTRAVEPLDTAPMWETGEVPDTYPLGY